MSGWNTDHNYYDKTENDDKKHDYNNYNDQDKNSYHDDYYKDDVNDKKLDKNVCSIKYETGPCKADILRYFYNDETDKCQEFSYGAPYFYYYYLYNLSLKLL